MATATTEKSSHSGPAEGQLDWQQVCEWLKAAQYEPVAEFLRIAQVEFEQTGDLLVASFIAALRPICLACAQYRGGTEWFRLAQAEAAQRENQLQEQLCTIFELLAERGLIEGPAQPATAISVFPIELSPTKYEQPELTNLHHLWQRVQQLLGRGPKPPTPKPEAVVKAVMALPAPPATPPDELELPTTVLVPASVEEAEFLALAPPEQIEVSFPAPFEVEKEPTLPALVIYCLGPFRVFQNDQLITGWSSMKGQSIFKYLIMHKGGPIAKDILMDVFWPDVDPLDTRRNLHQAIYSLRHTLRQDQPHLQPILFKQDCYLLNPDMVIWLDVEEFEKHVQAGRRREAAAQLAEAMAEYSVAEGLYQGDFFEEELYEDWPRARREYLRSMYLEIADRLSRQYVQQHEHTAAIALCQKILAKDNCYEKAYRQLMRCYLAQGQRHLAVRQYQTCVQALREELDLPPSEETVGLYRRITTS
jgi:two-component SAPR family response regulator/uncharacterized membrane protein